MKQIESNRIELSWFEIELNDWRRESKFIYFLNCVRVRALTQKLHILFDFGNLVRSILLLSLVQKQRVYFFVIEFNWTGSVAHMKWINKKSAFNLIVCQTQENEHQRFTNCTLLCKKAATVASTATSTTTRTTTTTTSTTKFLSNLSIYTFTYTLKKYHHLLFIQVAKLSFRR